MQGSVGPQRMGMRVKARFAAAVIAVIGALTLVTLYAYWRADRIQENLDTVNHFYVPVAKQLNLLNGKWSSYQRSFEQYVTFRRWGSRGLDLGSPKVHLKKAVGANLTELLRLISISRPAALVRERPQVAKFAEEFSLLADTEPLALAEIASLVKARQLGDAAIAYSRRRTHHLMLTQALGQLSREIEAGIGRQQLSSADEMRASQNTVLVLFAISVAVSMIVLLRLRRWFHPLMEWTAVAQEIALKGIHGGVRFPRVAKGMPEELACLTREFTRMGRTILEREYTIHQQKEKLSSLNQNLKERNESLLKLGALNELVLNGISSGIIVVRDTPGPGVPHVEQFNEAFCALFGVSRSEMLGAPARKILERWPEVLVERWLSASGPVETRRQVLGEGEKGRVFDVRTQRLPGETRRLLLFEDVTGQVRAEEKLEHARKLVLAADMSAQVAHEVRNPLNSMSLQLDMLEEDLGGNAEALARVRAIGEQVRMLERITKRYLDVGGLDHSGELGPRREAVDLHEIIERCCAFLSSEIQARQVSLELRLDAPRSTVQGDRDALWQVVLNLVRNALEALEESPQRRLRISTSAEGGSVRLCVTDTGPGVAAAMKPRLFEPFATDKAAGHGLGLSVSRQICLEHGGELRLVEEAMGATFEMSLPTGSTVQEVAHAAHPGR